MIPAGHDTYLCALTLWALPVLIVQWTVAGRILWRSRRLLGTAILLCGSYLSAADAVAIAHGIWQIQAGGITGIQLGGHLPLEEALFYFLTVTMSAQGFLMISGYFAEKIASFQRTGPQAGATEACDGRGTP